MFARTLRAVCRASTPVVSVRSCAMQYRHISISPVLMAKGKKAKKGAKQEPEESGSEGTESLALDFDKISQQYQSIMDNFKKQAVEAKIGKTSPTLFDKLKVETENGVVPFTQVAQTTIKGGRTFMISVFDAADTQGVINSILGSGLNMNPVRDSQNEQTLKVPLPPVTVESRKDNVKHLKEVYEEMKNGKKGSFAKVRADIKSYIQKHTKKNKKLTDAEKALEAEFETMHKNYLVKLSEAFKAAEKAILK